MTEPRQDRPRTARRRLALPLLSFLVLMTLALLTSRLRPPTADDAAAAQVEVPVSAASRPQGNASLVVTLRWGHTRPDGVATDLRGVQRWDGQLALTCGTVEEVLPLGFDPARGDSLAPVLPDQPVQWRSEVPQGRWAGLRLRVRTCAGGESAQGGGSGPGGGSGQRGDTAVPWLRIDTPFAHHELELRAGRNSFEAIPAGSADSRSSGDGQGGAEQRGDLLEVHVAPRAATLHVSDAPVT